MRSTRPCRRRRGVAALLGACDRRLLLRLADEEDAFVARERCQVLFRDVLLALPFLEGDEREAFALGEALDRRHEGPGHRGHERGCGEAVPAMADPEVSD